MRLFRVGCLLVDVLRVNDLLVSCCLGLKLCEAGLLAFVRIRTS